MNPVRKAAQVALDLSDVVHDVSLRASRRARNHLLFVLDRDDPTALELLTSYAPAQLQLARGGSDGVEVVALAMADGLNLLRAPQHDPTVFRAMADQIAGEQSRNVVGVCIAGGGFTRFAVRRTEVN